MLLFLISLTGLIIIIIYLAMQLPQFGKAPRGKRLERINKSPNYRNGKFQNLEFTTLLPEGTTMVGEVVRTFLIRNPRKFPTDSIPTSKTDLLSIPIDRNVLVWFGHSSYYLQIDGKRILVDPVLSGFASPFSFGVNAFKGTDRYNADDFPEIDYVLISHDHFDHLDYNTMMALKGKIKYVVCGLGVGESLEYWGFKEDQIVEKDWNETIVIEKNFEIHTATARHGSGRKLQTDNTLWLSYIIAAPSQRIYVGGDSGYGIHFSELGKKYGAFDLAILDNGQYAEDSYSTIHMPAKFSLKAAQDLNAKRLFPVHSSKFVLSRHPWDEPLVQISQLSREAKMPLVTPMIGEAVNLNNPDQLFKDWWQGLK